MDQGVGKLVRPRGRATKVTFGLLLILLGGVGCRRCDPFDRDPRMDSPDADSPASDEAAEEEPSASSTRSRALLRTERAASERRRCDGSAPEAVRLVQVVGGLQQPLYVTSEPGDAERLYVLEKAGKLKRVHAGGRTETLLDLPVRQDVEMGLLGMAFHPRFGEQERRIVLSYVNPDGWSIVSSFRLGEDALERDSEQVLVKVKQPAANHNGGMVAFGPDGLLYFGLGDGGGRDDQFGNGQNRSTLLGTIGRIDLEEPARALPGNLSGPDVDRRILHYGLRNPWRFSFDGATGDLYIADVGQDHWEEIDALPVGAPSANFGWPTFEGRHRCPGCRTNAPDPSADMKMPIHEYPRGSAASVTGGYVYRGTKIPSLVGRYLYSDFVHNWVRALTWDGERACDHHDLTSTLDPTGRLQGVASFGEDGDRELYLVSFLGGEVLRITPGS